ncbi:hypothetical protein, partial [Xanthomonas bonasiae]|uniref:hypothetical protein n=1 Tax=Xanthomonas bonasiae TaxID=2810351 RepID=UPI0019812BDB
LLLQRRLRQDDVVIAVAFDGRSDEQLADAIGPLTRYLPLRAAADAAPRLPGRATTLAQALAEAEEWQEYFTWPSPRAESVWAPGYGFALSAAPTLPRARWLAHSAHEDRFQLKLGVLLDGDRLACTLSYEPARHREADMVCLLRQWRTLLEASLMQPQAPVAALAHVHADERTALL